MIQKIINDKGGLNIRVTAKINLHPFTLKESQEYFKDNGISLPKTKKQVIRMLATTYGLIEKIDTR